MKEYLLPETGKFFKANLHCHTTVSDGSWTPEQVKEGYKQHGYSIVAYTDHDLMMPHEDLNDEEFLAMTGFEMEIGAPSKYATWGRVKTCHVCFVATSPDIKNMPFYNRANRNYTWGNAYKLAENYTHYDEEHADFVREYNPENISEMMRLGREKGFFVTYNHPAWSIEDYTNYTNYHGMHAMEMVNYSCLSAGYEEYNSRVYDDMLRAGERIYCVSTDDNHNVREDSYGGFTMIKAEKLDYKQIGQALLDGHFYASEAPEIYELWIEDWKIHIRTSEAVKISFVTQMTRAQAAYPKNGESSITEAVFDLNENYEYFRIIVTDKSGKRACTNAYFVKEDWLK